MTFPKAQNVSLQVVQTPLWVLVTVQKDLEIFQFLLSPTYRKNLKLETIPRVKVGVHTYKSKLRSGINPSWLLVAVKLTYRWKDDRNPELKNI